MKLWRALNSHSKLVGATAVLLASLYVAAHQGSGWIPHDEGQLGQAAERTLAGELPHRDFDDMYTGGLSFLNALSFHWFGVDSLSMRWMLLLWFIPAITAYYYLASRAASPLIATGVTVLGAMLSLPVYGAPMPSWYNLFLAIMGVAALTRYLETERPRWLIAAGLCGGISILFKFTGVFFVAAGLLFIAYREQLLAPQGASARGRAAPGWYVWMTSAALLAFAVLGLPFMRSGQPVISAIHFTLPLMALAFWLFCHERQCERGASFDRWQRLLSMAVPFCVGVAVPVAGFILYYAGRGALASLYEGTVVLPRLRMKKGAFPFPGWDEFAKALSLAALFALGLWDRPRSRQGVQYGAVAALALVLALSWTSLGFAFGFHAMRNILPLLVIIAIWTLARADKLQISTERRQQLFLVAAAAMLCSLVQYPHAYGIYFFYVAPLVLLVGLYLVESQPRPLRLAFGGVLSFYLVFAALWLNGPDPHANVKEIARPRPVASMGLERCNLTLAATDAETYRELVAEIASHSTPGSYIFAGPDCPEVYYLSHRQNFSRIMYEFFRPHWLADHRRLLDELDEHDVKVVVLNSRPRFSDRLAPQLVEKIASRFEFQRTISMRGDSEDAPVERFHVFWRD